MKSDLFFRENGIKPSFQRKKIYQYLLENRVHPTVNEIYSSLIAEIPVLSKATVYNTMNLFRDHNLVEVISVEGHESRYDLAGQQPHGHFKCNSCGRVYDVMIDVPIESISRELKGFKITGQNFNFNGTCRQCMEKKEGVS